MFNTDQPIKTQEDDILGRNKFAKELASAILKYKSKDTISIGLYGKWGSGKTSILNMILEEVNLISITNRPITIRFNPWYFSDQNQLIKEFFSELSFVLNRKNLSKKYNKIGKTLQKYSEFFIPFSLVPNISILGIIAKSIRDIGKATEKAGAIGEKNFNEIKKELNNLLSQIDKKLIIVIDDIDRLNNTEIRQIFQLIKSLADFPNTIYLLSFDKKVVINALKKIQEGSGEEYLEKVIQIPFEIPKISKQDVENYLFSKLHEIETGLDQIHWNNLYQSGMKYLFQNIRDVNRYLNSLIFGYELVKNDVNPFDFMAITAIQVLIPNLYNSIKDNKNLFTGIRPRSLLDTEERNKIEHDKIWSFVKQIDEEIIDHDSLFEFLLILFPKLKNINYSDDYYEKWRMQGRICSPNIFDIFFRLSIPNDEMSKKEIERILSVGNSIVTFSEELLELDKQSKIGHFLDRMFNYARRDIPRERIPTIICSLMNIGDQLTSNRYPNDISGGLDLLFNRLSWRLNDENERFEVFENAIKNAENSLYTIIYHIAYEIEKHRSSEPNDGAEYRKTIMTSEQLDKLKELCVEKIFYWAKTSKLQTHPNLIPILKIWRIWRDQKEINDYVKNITIDENGLIDFLSHFPKEFRMQDPQGYTGAVIQRIDMDELGNFVDLDEVENRLRNIRNSHLYEALEGHKKWVIKLFLDIRDEKIEDRHTVYF